jgi:hypothetical protein
METSEIRGKLLSLLNSTGIGNLPGKLLYSGLQTIKPFPLYFLGYSPGGDPRAENDPIRDHLLNSPENWNEYIDAVWYRRGILYPPGCATLQRRATWLFGKLGFDPREVPASNLVFVRSKAIASSIVGADRCWPLHSWIIEAVKPRAILVMGSDAFGFIMTKPEIIGPIDSFASGHGSWTCNRTACRLQGVDFQLISVPHLSRYAIDKNPEVADWIYERLKI